MILKSSLTSLTMLDDCKVFPSITYTVKGYPYKNYIPLSFLIQNPNCKHNLYDDSVPR
ncbi:hypothetical protein Lalb_Chr19g0128551 [Lupinus albus]|uniref:Uncharacterized protein n=1 Tax=Lupinus albus TaxID=3870 RepID=A0A6A4NF96_LUPAL|nr:hypothetical protein Lalb_Chr19g0128551 [Lupinus albus]